LSGRALLRRLKTLMDERDFEWRLVLPRDKRHLARITHTERPRHMRTQQRIKAWVPMFE